MTACVNKKSKRVAAVVTASLVGALSIGAPAVALATGVSTLATEATNNWAGGTFEWSTKANADGEYVVVSGDAFYLKSVVDVFGNPVSISDVTVLCVSDANGDGKAGDTEVVYKTTDLPTGKYVAVAVEGVVDTKAVVDGSTQWGNVDRGGKKSKEQAFEVIGKSLEGAYAVEGTDSADTAFKALGKDITVNIADKAGNVLGNQVGVVVKSAPKGAKVTSTDGVVTIDNDGTIAGKYTLLVKGVDGKDYEGNEATVSFTVDKVDLSKDVVTIAPIKADANGGIFSDQKLVNTKATIMINGEAAGSGLLDVTLVGGEKPNGSFKDNYQGKAPATVYATVSAAGKYAADFVSADATADATIYVVNDLVSFKYGASGTIVQNGNTMDLGTLISAKGQKFDAEELLAFYQTDKYVDINSVVVRNADGDVVTDWSEPGSYSFTATVNPNKKLEYAGSVAGKFTVVSSVLAGDPVVYTNLDGKAIPSTGVEYDAEAVVPTIVAKVGNTVLNSGTDYKVVYKDADGKEIDSIVDPGTYTVTVDFLGAKYRKTDGTYADVANVDFGIKVVKAQLRSAKADKTVYDLVDGKAVTPQFTAYTKAGCKGLSVDIDPSKVGVTYYKAALDASKKPYEVDPESTSTAKEGTGFWAVDGDPIQASDLNEAGWYVATVNVPADNEYIAGSAKQSVVFQISEFSVFEDVDAGQWYADAVYKANDLKYMTGAGNTNLFMPEANITRAQLAQVMFNMAGHEKDEDKAFPTRFADCAKDDWYSQAVAWASEAGVVNGYVGTDNFGPFDNATREQVAIMFRNYAKAQGKDVSVKDVEGTLAEYSDGASVDEWARVAVAWAVENGVMGNGPILDPQTNITRAQVAQMAVNFQPEALAKPLF